MKLFDRYSEYSINEIHLYAAPDDIIQGLVNDSKQNEQLKIVVKEYRPKKFKKDYDNNQDIIFEQDPSYRHQVVATYNLPIATITIHSHPQTSQMIENSVFLPLKI